ncbi:MAG: class beta-lactamase-related serine hydrolase [Alphaproteobacteria bacterium]|nr:class beta-lactamase-related serine hydrolase [Alphaproteobacteria bacterium]
MRSFKLLFAAFAAVVGVAAIAQHQVLPLQPLGPNPPPARSGATVPTAAPTPAGHPQLDAADVNAWLDGFMPYAIASGDIAGAVVVVVKDGRILAEKGYGFADVASRRPVDPEGTLFRPGSVSKLFTWTAVMQLVEQGKLDLDADVNRYIDFKIPPKDGKPLTLRQLMTHTAGFEEQAKSIIGFDRAKVPTYDVLLKRWVPERVYTPGTTPAYSNYGASLAGYIVQRVSGEPFDAYVERHVFGPIGMTNSTTRQPLPARLQPMMSTGYDRASGKVVKYEYVGPSPAGSVAATGADMGKFMIAHLNEGAGLLKSETARMMHSTALTIIPGVNRMVLGFYETNLNGHRAIGHGGDTVAFHSDLRLFLDDHVGVFVSFNSPGREGAAHILRGALMEDFADRYFPAPEDKGRVPAAIAAEHARMMTGTWVNSRGSHSSFMNFTELLGQSKVSVDSKGRLVAPVWPGTNGQPRQWAEVQPFVWQDVNGHERLAAEVKDGKVTRFSEDVFSPFMIFYRPAWYKNSALVLPLMILSLIVLLLTVLLWPVRALVRRHYKTPLALDGSLKRAHLWSRIAATAILATMAGWFGLVLAMLGSLELLSTASDPFVYLLEALSFVAFIGGFLILAWNLWVTWKGKRRWPAKVWSIALFLAALVILWVGLAFHLLSFGANY